MSARKHAASE